MIGNQFILPIQHELIVDLFAGGGGASTGIELATGRHVDIGVNHDPEAISLHQANHPQTRHFVSDVFEVDPVVVTDGQPVGLLWASPDCKHFSKAKGGKPVSKKIRSLAWVVVKWAKAVRSRVICLENVEEFQTWGPLGEDNMPCPKRKGQTFQLWLAKLRNLGYTVEWRELRACDYGAPTIRKRLFLVARCDGMPIVWPSVTHAQRPGKGSGLRAWRTASECIDWSIPAPSIFERSRPLADATCRRIAKGIMRYVVQAAEPFIVEVDHADRNSSLVQQPVADRRNASRGQVGPTSLQCDRVRNGQGRGGQGEGSLDLSSGSVRDTRGAYSPAHAISSATLIQTGYGEREGQSPRVPGLDKPIGTLVGSQKHALVTAFLAKHYTGVIGSDMGSPISTVTSVDHHSLVSAHLVTIDNQSSQSGQSAVTDPLKTTVTENRHALVKAFLVAYYGADQDPGLRDPMHTITTRDRFGLVTIHGTDYAIVDIGLRMLTPRELYRAQGFPESYQIDRGAAGEPITKTAQVRMCGNSVCPPLAKAVVAANFNEQQSPREAA